MTRVPRRVLLALAAVSCAWVLSACNAEPHVNVGKAKSLANIAGSSAGNGGGAGDDDDDEHEGSAGDDQSDEERDSR